MIVKLEHLQKIKQLYGTDFEKNINFQEIKKISTSPNESLFHTGLKKITQSSGYKRDTQIFCSNFNITLFSYSSLGGNVY